MFMQIYRIGMVRGVSHEQCIKPTQWTTKRDKRQNQKLFKWQNSWATFAERLTDSFALTEILLMCVCAHVSLLVRTTVSGVYGDVNVMLLLLCKVVIGIGYVAFFSCCCMFYWNM